jgi:MarR family transcriptional regulator, transcriptional regulator for hemolysin
VGTRIGPALGFRLARVTKLMREQVDAELRPHGLTQATWRPLVYLSTGGDGTSQKELAQALGVEGPSVVTLLDGLERRGLIRRQPDEVDRRVRRIFLTDAGRELQRKVHSIGEATERRMLAGIRRDDLDVFMRVLDVLDAALDENTV